MFAPCRGSAVSRVATAKKALPGFLAPAWQQQQHSNFSTTGRLSSKLGRTPISIPPGVELVLGEPVLQRGAREWKATAKRTITVKGPLGAFRDLNLPHVCVWRDEC